MEGSLVPWCPWKTVWPGLRMPARFRDLLDTGLRAADWAAPQENSRPVALYVVDTISSKKPLLCTPFPTMMTSSAEMSGDGPDV